jgi:hypothetical protein
MQIHVRTVWTGPKSVHWAALLTDGVQGGACETAAAICMHAAEALRTGVEAQLDPLTASGGCAYNC